jgi:hypothetical protein
LLPSVKVPGSQSLHARLLVAVVLPAILVPGRQVRSCSHRGWPGRAWNVPSSQALHALRLVVPVLAVPSWYLPASQASQLGALEACCAMLPKRPASQSRQVRWVTADAGVSTYLPGPHVLWKPQLNAFSVSENVPGMHVSHLTSTSALPYTMPIGSDTFWPAWQTV